MDLVSRNISGGRGEEVLYNDNNSRSDHGLLQIPDQTADGPVHPRLRARAAADVLRLRLSQDYAHSKTLVLRFGRGV